MTLASGRFQHYLVGDDEWDPYLLLEALDGENTQQQESHDQAKKKKRKKKQLNPNKARDERRAQLIQLRKEAEELEWTLKKWQNLRASQRPLPACEEKTNGASINSEAPAVWEEICARQLQRRLKAERENFRRMQRTNLPPGYIQRMAAALFEELAAGMQVCYYLGANTPVPADVRPHTPLLRGGLKGDERTFFDRRLVPFSMEAASDA